MQVDRPMDLNHDPANLCVAGLPCAPSMNFIKVAVKAAGGDQAAVANASLEPIAVPTRARPFRAGDTATRALRLQYLRPTMSDEGMLRGRVVGPKSDTRVALPSLEGGDRDATDRATTGDHHGSSPDTYPSPASNPAKGGIGMVVRMKLSEGLTPAAAPVVGNIQSQTVERSRSRARRLTRLALSQARCRWVSACRYISWPGGDGRNLIGGNHARCYPDRHLGGPKDRAGHA